MDNQFKKFEKEVGHPILKKDLELLLNAKKFENYELIEGDIKTLNSFLKKKNLKISYHLDMDVFDATNFVINKLKKYIVKNGVILIDDYEVFMSN